MSIDFLSSSTVHQLWNYRNPDISFDNRLIRIDNNLFDSNYSYTMGWELFAFTENKINGLLSNLTFIHHFGLFSGTTAILGIFPEQEIAISIITNFGGIEGTLHLTVLKILQNFIHLN